MQGFQIGSFGAKKQKFGSFEKRLAPKFLFGYLALLQLIRSTNFSSGRVASGTCSLRMSTQLYLQRDREDVQVERAICPMQCPVNLFLLCIAFKKF